MEIRTTNLFLVVPRAVSVVTLDGEPLLRLVVRRSTAMAAQPDRKPRYSQGQLGSASAKAASSGLMPSSSRRYIR